VAHIAGPPASDDDRARRVNGSSIPAAVMESTTSAGLKTRVDISAPPFAEKYVPATDTWVAADKTPATLTQALTLLNNEFTLKQAGYFADRVWQAAGPNPEKQVTEMYHIAFSRDPNTAEMRQNLAFLKKQTDTAAAKNASGDSAARSALNDLAHVTLNLNEFVYIK